MDLEVTGKLLTSCRINYKPELPSRVRVYNSMPGCIAVQIGARNLGRSGLLNSASLAHADLTIDQAHELIKALQIAIQDV